MNFKVFTHFLKKPLANVLITFFIQLISSQYIAYQKYINNKSEQKKEIDHQVNVIEEKLNAEIEIYPNPARDFINIDFDSDDQKKCELIIYNQFGQRINKYFSVLGGGESYRINIETLTPGIYFINVITPSGETLKQKLEVVN